MVPTASGSMMARVLLTLILSFLVLIETNASSIIDCSRSRECDCTLNPGQYEYRCPPFPNETEVIVTLKPQYAPRDLQIDCDKDGAWDKLPLNLELGELKRFTIRFCRLPETFREFMDRLGVNETVLLKFEYADVGNASLSKNHFADLTTLQRLRLEGDELEGVEEDVFEELPDLVEISLQRNKLRRLPGRIFAHAPELLILDVANNKLEDLPAEIFKNLTKLKTLHAWKNNLTTLPSGIFDDLINLTSLDLSFNRLHSLQHNLLSNLNNLKELNLDGNRLQQLPQELFKSNQHLQYLRMSMNQNLSVPSGLLSNLKNLSKVALTDNKLKSLPEDLFFNSTNLQEVKLQQNELIELPVNLFDGLGKLEILDLSSNKLRAIEDIFDSLENLKELYLKDNLISKVGSSAFRNLHSLTKLVLSNNQIDEIHEQAFLNNNQIVEINMAYNKLRQLESDFGVTPFNYCIRLEYLYLSHNLITDVPQDVATTLIKLRKLDLSYNRIPYVQWQQLATAADKLEFDLSNNNISFVDLTNVELHARLQIPGAYSDGDYSVVDLSDNPIECDCRAYDLTRYFKEMMDPQVRMMFEILPGGLKCAPSSLLEDVSVADLHPKDLTCSLMQIAQNYTDCPQGCACAWRKWDKSIVISCENGNWTEAPPIFLPEGLEKLVAYNQTEVHLEGNLLISGPSFNDTGYENVTKLFLSNNRIKNFNWVSAKTQVLQLHNNSIERLEYTVLDRLNKSDLTNVTLHDNPWTCDCFAANLTKFLRLHVKQVDPRQIKCSKDSRKLVDLTEKDLCHTYTVLILVLSMSLTGLFLIVAIGLALFYRHQQEVKVWLFAHNILLWWVTEEEVDKHKKYDAFICFSHKDDNFVIQELVPILEKGPDPYKLCIHYRDWIAGEFISSQIAESVQNSRRTVIVLSKSFLESVWGKMEFRIAHKQSMVEGRARVIVILYGDIDLNTDLDDELKAYIKTNTYVKWGDPYFWNKVKYALPHSQKLKKSKNQQKQANIMQSLDDKFSLSAVPISESTPPIVTVDPLIKAKPLTNGTEDCGLNPLLMTINK